MTVATPYAPGALHLLFTQLADEDFIEVIVAGQRISLVPLGQLKEFISANRLVVVSAGSAYEVPRGNSTVIVDTDAPLAVSFATPFDGQRVTIKGNGSLDIGTNAITLNATINGQPSLVMEAAWMAVTIVYSEELGQWYTV